MHLARHRFILITLVVALSLSMCCDFAKLHSSKRSTRTVQTRFFGWSLEAMEMCTQGYNAAAEQNLKVMNVSTINLDINEFTRHVPIKNQG